MHRWYPFWQLLLSRIREFYREPEVLFWVYGFPVVLAVGLGIAFSSHAPEAPAVDVQEVPELSEAAALVEQLQAAGLPAELHPEEACRQRLRIGKTALFVVPASGSYGYVYDPTRPESQQARYQVDNVIQRWKAAQVVWPTSDVTVQEPGSRYIDFLLPGLMGLNLMGGGLWGVGFLIVDMRVRKLLKRLLATPMRRGDFLLAILSGRLLFMLPEMVLLVVVGRWGFGVPLSGSLGTLSLVVLVGAAAFSGLGLLTACRASKTETISGLMNLIMLPMWLLSGTFFSSKRFPDVTQPFIQALPLTQLNDALREVMLEGAGLAKIGGRLAILTAWALISFLLALKWFRWQ
jgi:ABC-2 type transport system permease protein